MWIYFGITAILSANLGFLIASQVSISHHDEIIEQLLEQNDLLKQELEELKKD